MSRILVIAGTDPSGGAGLSRDIAMAAALGCSVSPVVTAVTVQTNVSVVATQTIAPDIVAAQIDAALDSSGMPPKAVKIGMLGTRDTAIAVARALPQGVPVVLDPVLRSSSGGRLTAAEALMPLLDRITLLTPNLQETAQICHSSETEDPGHLETQARLLRAMGPEAVLIKGGHGSGPLATDHLFHAAGHYPMASPRLARGKRGTGCSLATAIACQLALGHDLKTACSSAKQAVHDWLRT